MRMVAHDAARIIAFTPDDHVLLELNAQLAMRGPQAKEEDTSYWGGYAAGIRDLIASFDTEREAYKKLQKNVGLLKNKTLREILALLRQDCHTIETLAKHIPILELKRSVKVLFRAGLIEKFIPTSEYYQISWDGLDAYREYWRAKRA
jgi:hypothetical protein